MRQPPSAAVEQKQTVLVDLRPAAEFAQGHLQGAVSLPFSPRGLADRLAVVVEPGTPVRLLAFEPAVIEAARAQLRDRYRIAGVVDRTSLQAAALEEPLPDIPVQVLADGAAGGDVLVLDVREPIEWETGFAPGAVLISLGSLRARLGEIARDKLVAVICESGVRSSTGASLLLGAGFPNVATVSEGMSGYRRAGLAVELPEGREDG